MTGKVQLSICVYGIYNNIINFLRFTYETKNYSPIHITRLDHCHVLLCDNYHMDISVERLGFVG